MYHLEPEPPRKVRDSTPRRPKPNKSSKRKTQPPDSSKGIGFETEDKDLNEELGGTDLPTESSSSSDLPGQESSPGDTDKDTPSKDQRESPSTDHVITGAKPISPTEGVNDSQDSGSEPKGKPGGQKEGKDRTGVVYLSRIPPFMGLSKLRALFSKLGKIGRVYLHPEDAAEYNRRLKFGGNRRMKFSHGWVEFLDKSDAKRAALVLNNRQVDEKRFWKFDLWNVRYLPSFKWSDLVEYFSFKRDERMELGHLIRNERRRNREYLEQLEREKRPGGGASRRRRRLKAEASGSESAAPIRVKEDGLKERRGVSADLINSILA